MKFPPKSEYRVLLLPETYYIGVCISNYKKTHIIQSHFIQTAMQMWTDNIVKTVIIMMNVSCEGHEGDWVLHLLVAEAMLPYFRSAGCHNYARYAAF